MNLFFGKYTRLFTGMILVLISCSKPICPEPNINSDNFTINVDTNYCAGTTPPLTITPCAITLLENVNRILYARLNPNDGIQHRQCPGSERWKPNEVIFDGRLYTLFTQMDTCNTLIAPYAFISDYPGYKYEFALFNAKTDNSFAYYGFCPPALRYRDDTEWDSAQQFLFYYEDSSGTMISIPKSNILKIKSVSLDCNYINNKSPLYSSGSYYLNSSLGISVKLEVKDLKGFSPGNQVIKAYIQSVTSSGGVFAGWVGSFYWKSY